MPGCLARDQIDRDNRWIGDRRIEMIYRFFKAFLKIVKRGAKHYMFYIEMSGYRLRILNLGKPLYVKPDGERLYSRLKL